MLMNPVDPSSAKPLPTPSEPQPHAQPLAAPPATATPPPDTAPPPVSATPPAPDLPPFDLPELLTRESSARLLVRIVNCLVPRDFSSLLQSSKTVWKKLICHVDLWKTMLKRCNRDFPHRSVLHLLIRVPTLNYWTMVHRVEHFHFVQIYTPDTFSFTADDAEDMCARLAKNTAATYVMIQNGTDGFCIMPPLLKALEALGAQEAPKLKHLSLKRCAGPFEPLFSLSFLSELDLRFCSIVDVQGIASALANNNTLRRLWLNENKITDCEPFVRVLDNANRTLKSLELKGNPLSNPKLLKDLIEKKIVLW